MSPIVLKQQTATGDLLQATFLPEMGMNLISFKKGDLEIIDQSTRSLFEERYAGLGALIGPHFHRRKPETLPVIKEEHLFPHIARVKAKGVLDPFSHGIARYAPWQAEATETHLKAKLTGKDTWNGVSLASLEGQNFTMQLEAHLKENGLFLELSVVSDTASLVGIHYYYALSNGKGKVTSQVQKKENDDSHQLMIEIGDKEDLDFTFHPYPKPLEGHILLETDAYHLHTRYSCACEENSWQLYHPKGASFVCIEPLSSQDPRHPNLSVSALQIHLEILPITDRHHD